MIQCYVTLRNSEGKTETIWSEGDDYAEAAMYAVEDHRADTKDPTWEVVKEEEATA